MLNNPPDNNEVHQDIIIDLVREIQELGNFDAPHHHEWVSAESKAIAKSTGDGFELSDEAAGQFGDPRIVRRYIRRADRYKALAGEGFFVGVVCLKRPLAAVRTATTQ